MHFPSVLISEIQWFKNSAISAPPRESLLRSKTGLIIYRFSVATSSAVPAAMVTLGAKPRSRRAAVMLNQ